MIKKKYKALEILKKIKKKDLISGLSSLSSEKDKLKLIGVELKELLNQSKIQQNQIFFGSQLKNTSNYRENLQEKIEISKNREIHLNKEIDSYLNQISKVKKKKEKIQEKIKDELASQEKTKELRNNQNFRAKNFI